MKRQIINKLSKILNSECKHKPYRDKENDCWYCKECENYLGCKDYSLKELKMRLKYDN